MKKFILSLTISVFIPSLANAGAIVNHVIPRNGAASPTITITTDHFDNGSPRAAVTLMLNQNERREDLFGFTTLSDNYGNNMQVRVCTRKGSKSFYCQGDVLPKQCMGVNVNKDQTLIITGWTKPIKRWKNKPHSHIQCQVQ